MSASTASSIRARRRGMLLAGCAVALPHAPALAQSALMGSHVTQLGSATVVSNGIDTDTVTVSSPTAIINWTPSNPSNAGVVDFLPAGKTAVFTGSSPYTVLNRVLPGDGTSAVGLNGNVQSNVNGATGGNVWFYSPGGIVVGAGAVFDVGSLLLTANDPRLGPVGELITNGYTLSAASGSTAAVEIKAGARINALNAGSYVALVAPRVIQGGDVRVNGAAAYVAAEQATLTVNSGLFDISVGIGSDADTPGGATLTHSGTTSGSASTGAGDPRRAYLVAVPKNQMISMLVGGQIGFDAASSASIENGVVVLGAGYGAQDVTPDAASGGGAAAISISGASFTSAVVANATGDFSAISTDTASAIAFAQGLNVNAAGAITLSANGVGAAITGDGGQSLRATPLASSPDRVGGNIVVEALNGGDIALTGNFSADVRPPLIPSVGAGKGGTISITADGGHFSLGATTLAAGADNPGYDFAEGDGGSVTISTANSARQSTIASLTINADGAGGVSGNGVGGGVTITADGAGLAVNGALAISARGIGGEADSFSPGSDGGSGTGGSVNIVGAGPFSATSTTIDVSGTGGAGTAEAGPGDLSFGGDGLGGTVSISTTGPLALGGVDIDATGRGGGGNGSGSGLGGGITVETGGGAIFGDLLLDASGFGGAGITPSGPYGDGAGDGGIGIGGSIDFHVLGGNTTASSLQLLAKGAGGAGSNGTGGAAGGQGGSAGGGAIFASVESGDLSVTGATTLDVSAGGGRGGNGTIITIPAGAGGDITPEAPPIASFRTEAGASAHLATLEVLADARGGDAGGIGVGGGNGGFARAGNATVVGAGTLITTGDVKVSASATGGDGQSDAGNAQGGEASLRTGTGGSVTIGGNASLLADATGGSSLGGGRNGDALGGIVVLATREEIQAFVAGDGGAISIAGTTLLSAMASASPVGFGGAATGQSIDIVTDTDGLMNLTGAVTVRAGANAGNGSDGTSDATGAAFVLSLLGGSETRIGGLSVDTSAVAIGDGSNATGGAITIATSGFGPTLTAGAITVNSAATAGEGITTTGGTAQGGDFQISTGNATLSFGTLSVDAHGTGGAGINGINGGDGHGGAVSISAFDGTVTGGNVSFNTSGIGGAAGQGATGGSGFGGDVSLAENGYGGGLLSLGDTAISAFGQGGGARPSAQGVNGGAGTGGNLAISAQGSPIRLASLNLDARGLGANGGDSPGSSPAGNGGASTGGQANLFTSSGGLSIAGAVAIDTSGTGGDGGAGLDTVNPMVAGTGGDATGGQVRMTTSGGSLALGNTTIRSGAIAGTGGSLAFGSAGAGGNATAGAVQFSSDSGAFHVGDLTLDASALGGAGGLVGDEFGYGASGGAAQGGDIGFQLGGGASFGAVTADTHAAGGAADGGLMLGGAATAGDFALNANGGGGASVTLSSLTANLTATGGDGTHGAGGGAARGGDASIGMFGANGTILGALLLNSQATGGASSLNASFFPRDAGGATGGAITLSASGQSLTVGGGATLLADAAGGLSAGGTIAAANGGSIALDASNGTITLGGDLRASADAVTRTSPGTAFTSGGGAAQGGTVTAFAGEGNIAIAGNADLHANAIGADAIADPSSMPVQGASGLGGAVTTQVNTGTLTIGGALNMAADGQGGAGSGGGGAAGEGRGGTATIALGGDANVDVTGAVALTAAGLSTGLVTPGTAFVAVDAGTFSAAALDISDGTLAFGGDTANGFQGSATTTGDVSIVDRSGGQDSYLVGGQAGAVIDFTPTDQGSGDILFLPHGNGATYTGPAGFAILDRVNGGTRRVLLNGGVRGVDINNGDSATGEIGIFNAGGITAGSGASLRAGKVVLTTNSNYVPEPVGTAFQGTPTVSAGDVTISRTPTQDTITVGSSAAILNWSVYDDRGTGTVDFLPAGLTALFQNDPSKVGDFTILNRILPTDARRPIAFNGTVQSRVNGAPGGHVWFYSPGGIVVGANAVFDVGSLLLSTAAPTLNGDGTIGLAGTPGSNALVSIASGAQINAAGSVALVAPRITQQGTIRAGTSAALIAADTATLDLTGAQPAVRLLAGTSAADGDVLIDHGGGDTSGASVLIAAATQGGRGVIALNGGQIAGDTVISGGGAAGGTVDIALDGGFLGNVTASASGALTADAVSATGDLILNASALAIQSASAGGLLSLTSATDLTLGSGFGQSVALSGDRVGASLLVAGSGTLAVHAGTGGATIGTLQSGGVASVEASGDVAIDNALSSSSLLVASDNGSVTLGGASTAMSSPPSMSAGLRTESLASSDDGGITLSAARFVLLNGPVTARGKLLINSGGTATFVAETIAQEIDVTSSDIDIGRNAILGGGAGTDLVRLTTLPGIRSFIGGTGANAPAGSYVITDAELNRIRAGAIVLESGVVGTDPNRPADVVVDVLNLGRPTTTSAGVFFGPAALFRVRTPGTLEIVGQSRFTNLLAPDRLEFIAGDTLQAIAPAATVTLTGPDSLPAGTLLFQANRIIVATEAAAREVAALSTIGARANRLAQSDGVDQPLGYLSANALEFRVGSALYIQNSGGKAADDRAGFTVGPGGVTITSLNGGRPEVIINGRGVAANGGKDLSGRDLVSVLGGLAPGSSVNGCTASSPFCGDIADVLDQASAAFAATNEGTLQNQLDQEQREKASFRPRVPALIEVRGIAAPSAPPVIDSPVTGAGNDDLWVDTTPMPPIGAGAPARRR